MNINNKTKMSKTQMVNHKTLSCKTKVIRISIHNSHNKWGLVNGKIIKKKKKVVAVAVNPRVVNLLTRQKSKAKERNRSIESTVKLKTIHYAGLYLAIYLYYLFFSSSNYF